MLRNFKQVLLRTYYKLEDGCNVRQAKLSCRFIVERKPKYNCCSKPVKSKLQF